MELVIYNPTEEQFIKEISFNADEIKTELAQRLEKYNGLVYSEENIKEAKADRATLNKFKTAIEDKRKEMKKMCLAPYEKFEIQIKEITAMVDKPILAIDSQVKAFEQIKQDEKLEGIKIYYADKIGDLAKLVPFEKIYNPKWMNVTYKGSEIEKEITDLFVKVESDLKVITELQSEYELQIKDTYLKNFDLTAALQEKKRLEEQAAKMAEYQRLQKEREAAASSEPKQTEEAKLQQKVIPAEEASFPKQEPVEPEVQLFKMDFRVWASREQLTALKQFLVDNGIKYGKVE
jgi:hypothetical protein